MISIQQPVSRNNMKEKLTMTINVRKATDTDIANLRNNPTWDCEISEFDWYYDSE